MGWAGVFETERAHGGDGRAQGTTWTQTWLHLKVQLTGEHMLRLEVLDFGGLSRLGHE